MARKHTECRRVGKFDCWADERINELLQEGFIDTEGDVESPAGWFAAVDLDVECEGHPHDPSLPGSVAGVDDFCDGSCRPEYRLAQHYGSPWLVAREDSQGFFWVAAHASEEARDEHVASLRLAYETWEVS